MNTVTDDMIDPTTGIRSGQGAFNGFFVDSQNDRFLKITTVDSLSDCQYSLFDDLPATYVFLSRNKCLTGLEEKTPFPYLPETEPQKVEEMLEGEEIEPIIDDKWYV